MKQLIYLLILFLFFSCQEKQVKNTCIEIEKKYDSILNLNYEYNNSIFNKFSKILSKEQGVALDSILISDYKKIEGKHDLVDLYIWDRINTINQNINKLNVYQVFKGNYILKPIHNKKYAKATKITIEKDSIYLYKNNSLAIKDKFKLLNSSDKFVKGKIRINNYKISLLDFSSKSLIFDDNSCMDCEQLQFYKIN